MSQKSRESFRSHRGGEKESQGCFKIFKPTADPSVDRSMNRNNQSEFDQSTIANDFDRMSVDPSLVRQIEYRNNNPCHRQSFLNNSQASPASRLRPVNYVSFTSPKKKTMDERMNTSQTMALSPDAANQTNRHFNYSTFSPEHAR